MRKIKGLLIILVALFLFACSKSVKKQLEELGYQENEIETILGYSEDIQNRFLESHDERLYEIVTNENYKEENLDQYLKFDKQLDDDLMFDLVNRNLLTESNVENLKELYSSEYYIAKNEKEYLYYMNKCDSVRDAIELVNCKRYMELFSNITTTDISKDTLMLVNKYYQLPSDYEPNDLVLIDSNLGKGYTREITYSNYKALYEDALKEGYQLKIVSAYRSYSYQEGLYAKYLQYDPQEVVDTYSARPGHSEHQSGLCLDVSVPGYSIDDFYKTEASIWLKDNCYKYGFIIRYTEEKVNMTGYQAEPWQIRYVGKEVAKYIQDTGITFDEYYACFVENE